VATTTTDKLSGRQKAAILLISLGPEISSKVFKFLKDEEIEAVSLSIAAQKAVPAEIREKVLYEFHQIYQAQQYISQGGLDYAREILERSLGSAKAMEVIQRLTASLQVRPFDFIRKTDPSQLLSFIQNEHPQTIALILAYLHPDQAATILGSLPPERQAEVARRLAIMDRTAPEVIKDVERVLERKLSSLINQEFTAAGGVESVVEVLNRVDRATERTIMEALAVQDPELAEEIKKRMFLFEDIIHLDNRYVQRLLRELDPLKDLPLALKVASEDLKKKFFANISKRSAESLKEAMEFMGPVRLRDVEEAQAKVVNIVRKLDEAGEIVIGRGGGDDVLV
jgi:flagellar motor switch protein FliG